MDVGVVLIFPSAMDGQRIWHPALLSLPADGQFGDESAGQGDAFLLRKLDRQSELILAEKGGVLALLSVGGLPEKAGVSGSPFRHVSGLGKQYLPGSGEVLPGPHDVVELRLCRLPRLPAPDARVQVVDGHLVLFPFSPCGGRGRVSGACP